MFCSVPNVFFNKRSFELNFQDHLHVDEGSLKSSFNIQKKKKTCTIYIFTETVDFFFGLLIKIFR